MAEGSVKSQNAACYFCGTPVENPREVYRSSSCSSCKRDLKICLNCRFYSQGVHWDCSETIDEPVIEKDRANFCTFFSFRSSPLKLQGTDTSAEAKEKARRKLDQLFGDGS